MGNMWRPINTLQPTQNGWHFSDIFQCIFLNENVWILTTIWLKFVPNWQKCSIVSDNGLAVNRQQAIIWTNEGLSWWLIYASLGLNEIITYQSQRVNQQHHHCKSLEDHVDWLVQERLNSIANALELCLSCTNPSIWSYAKLQVEYSGS